MLPLHPQFRQTLLAAYHHLERDEQAHQLTQQDLENYDQLASKHHLLRQVQQGALGKPASTVGRTVAATMSKTVELDQALQHVNESLHGAMSDSMPDFHKLHERWFSSQNVRELSRANCAYSAFWQPIRSAHGGFSPFILAVGGFIIAGVALVVALVP